MKNMFVFWATALCSLRNINVSEDHPAILPSKEPEKAGDKLSPLDYSSILKMNVICSFEKSGSL
jgi:hypothetical protein